MYRIYTEFRVNAEYKQVAFMQTTGKKQNVYTDMTFIQTTEGIRNVRRWHLDRIQNKYRTSEDGNK
jgi:hypothetical protein